MIKITILSCYQVIDYIPQGKAAIIRIGDTVNEFGELKGNYEKKLELCFYDIYPKPYIPSNFNVFSDAEAEILNGFFKEIKEANIDELVIHCHAGVSRSPAIALSYAWYLGKEVLEQDIMNSGRYIPNGHVLKVMANKLGVENRGSVRKLLDRFYQEDYDIEE